MIALLFLLIALFGTTFGSSSGGSGVTTVPAKPAPAPRVATTQPGLAPAAKPCVKMLQTPCNSRSRLKP